jgi:hypothetical protein
MKEDIINKTIEIMNKLPQDKVEEIYDFASFVEKRFEDEVLTQGIQILMTESGALDFLKSDEGIYTLDDSKEKLNK